MTAVRRVDLNCDMGESFGPWRLGDDAAIMPHISSANVACGFHAGDPLVMQATVALAREHGVAVGAHVSYRDLHGFGRRELAASPEELYGDVLYQLGALAAICRVAGVRLRHVKPHGALYHAAARSAAVAEPIVRAVRDFDPDLVLFALPGGHLERLGVEYGLRVAREAFADRGYNPDGTLVPRQHPGAVIRDPEAVAERVVRMVTEGSVPAVDGTPVPLRPDTVCVHGDTPGAAALVRRIRERLAAAGIAVAPPGSP